MIATCPRCSVRYRIAKEKLKPEGVRMRCASCEAVFRVRPPVQGPAPAPEPSPPLRQPEAPPVPQPETPPPVQSKAAQAVGPQPSPKLQPEPGDQGTVVLVAIPDAELAKQTAAVLQRRGLRTSVVHDGVEAMLEVQRQLPKAVLLSASLPKMYGFQVCEVMKRNESLRSIGVVLAGSIHHTDRYRREPNELYGADAYLEDPDLPEGVIPILERMGIPMTGSAPPIPEVASPPQPAAREPLPSAPSQPAAPEPASVAAPQAPAARKDDGLAEERAKAERLARIIVSDIVLYNEEKFADAVARNCVVEMMTPDLEEGRELFRSRIDERVREEQDHLAEELLRVARLRGVQ